MESHEQANTSGVGARLQTLMQQLEQVAALQPEADAAPAISETIADDIAAIPAELKEKIQQEEEIARALLKLLGHDYDALIGMNNNSAYARAVAQNPAVLQQIMADKHPVLAALGVALNFKPYAEFMEKYGTDPAAIKQAIRAEIENENKQHVKEQLEPAPFKPTPFTAPYGGVGGGGKVYKPSASLADIFNK